MNVWRANRRSTVASTFNPKSLFAGVLCLGVALAGIVAIVRAVRGMRAGTVPRHRIGPLFLAVGLAELLLIPMGLMYVLFAFVPPES